MNKAFISTQRIAKTSTTKRTFLGTVSSFVMNPCLHSGLPLDDLAVVEPEADLPIGRIRGVGAVHDVTPRFLWPTARLKSP